MTIYIKNMVCNRCKIVVKSILEQVGLHPLKVELGEVELLETDIKSTEQKLRKELQAVGFSLLDDKKTRTIEKIKTLIIDLIQNKNGFLKTPLSEHISHHLLQDYSFLSHLFSEVEGITIEKYFILQRIEKVKELLVYNEITLSEIAFQLNYSSAGHLSNQFKKVTGLSPSHFKKMGSRKRNPLEDL